MKEYRLCKDHKIEVTKKENGVEVRFYESYNNGTRWSLLNTETWATMEDVEWFYDIEA